MLLSVTWRVRQVNGEVRGIDDESLDEALTDFAPALCGLRSADKSLTPGSPRAVALKAAFARGFPYAGYRYCCSVFDFCFRRVILLCTSLCVRTQSCVWAARFGCEGAGHHSVRRVRAHQSTARSLLRRTPSLCGVQ